MKLHVYSGSDSGGGFFLACGDFGWRLDDSFPPALFVFFFFFKVEISSCTLIPLFRPGPFHSGSASWDDCGRVYLHLYHEAMTLHTYIHFYAMATAAAVFAIRETYIEQLCEFIVAYSSAFWGNKRFARQFKSIKLMSWMPRSLFSSKC